MSTAVVPKGCNDNLLAQIPSLIMNIVTDALTRNLKPSKNKKQKNEGKPRYWIKTLRFFLHPLKHLIDQHLVAWQTAKPQQVKRSHGSNKCTTPLQVAPSHLQDTFRIKLLLAPRSDRQSIVPFRYFLTEKRLERAVKAKLQKKIPSLNLYIDGRLKHTR